MTKSDRYRLVAGLIALVAFGARIGYLLSQPDVDPWFARPSLDGALYVDWARNLLDGAGGPGGAYYHAPGYPWFLAGFFALAGLRFGFLYLVQHGMIVASALFLGEMSRKSAGDIAGWVSMILVLGYQPLLFFASRPVGEPFGIFLLVAALLSFSGTGVPRKGLAGLLAGAAVLVRPNFLLVVVAWMILGAVRKQVRPTAIMAGCAALVILPVGVRNLAASGHFVPVSSNAGLTLYHGNGPGALGIFTPVAGFSSRVDSQKDEATRIARERTGDPGLDAVQADRWWARQALATRLRSPGDTARLFFRKMTMTMAGDEIGLDYHPGIDDNRWRHTAPFSFALILGLAGAGWYVRKRGGGTARTVLAGTVALAVTPLLFYVSCRYRLPLAALLVLPAGAGATWILEESRKGWRPALFSLVIPVVLGALSWWMPTAGLAEATRAGALSNRAGAWHRAGEELNAKSDIAKALAMDGNSSPIRFQHGVILEADGDLPGAARAYGAALNLAPLNPDVAGNLAGVLIRQGQAAQAAQLLSPVVVKSPWHRVCQVNFVVALAGSGDLPGAREAARGAATAGIDLPPALLEVIGAGTLE